MPLTANDRLILIRVKIERARKHLADLAADLLAAENVTVVHRQNEAINRIQSGFFQLGENTGPDQFVTLPRLPFDAIATAGDLVHNLRTALDHLAHQLVIVGSGKEPSRRIEFPIAKDIATYESDKAKKVEGMRPDAIKAIDALKPYKGGNDTLWRIHELDNIDKHRTLFSIAHDYLFFGEWFDGDYWFKTNAPHFAGVQSETETDVQLEIDNAVGQSKVGNSDALLPSLHRMVDFADELVSRFLPWLE